MARHHCISAATSLATDLLSSTERRLRGEDGAGLERPCSGAGYVTRFQVRQSFLYAVQEGGGIAHFEYWIPAEHLEDFNAAMVGTIEVVKKLFLIAKSSITIRCSLGRNEVPPSLLLLFGTSCVD